jgi:uncharacterized protein (TIGR02996 family)
MRAAFERAILENPDDRGTFAAYADWLFDQGDPRGELMQVQLALEEEGRDPDERTRLRQRETELLAAHQAEWLGALAPRKGRARSCRCTRCAPCSPRST